MNLLEDVVLGLVQGLTEFLPVSSSGHLVVVPAVFGWDEPSLTFDLVLHLGTLIAVVVYYRRELSEIVAGVFGRGDDPRGYRRLLLLLVIGSIPAAIAGLAFGEFFEDRFEEPLWACFELTLNAGILLGAEWLVARGTTAGTDRPVEGGRAATIGVAQAVAITPGISRSGATIATGMVLGVSRADATRFSFLLSIPAIAGAVASRVPDVTGGDFDLTGSVIAGFLVAMVSGYLSIGVFLRFVRTHTLRPFAYYLLIMAPTAALIIELR
ncbi:MAG: undecaprenyl-diphosphate phosphatase [Acidimicrobiia bacterium]